MGLEVGLCSTLSPTDRGAMLGFSMPRSAAFTGRSLSVDCVERETTNVFFDVVSGQRIRMERNDNMIHVALLSGLDDSEVSRIKWPHTLKLADRMHVFVRVFEGNPLRQVIESGIQVIPSLNTGSNQRNTKMLSISTMQVFQRICKHLCVCKRAKKSRLSSVQNTAMSIQAKQSSLEVECIVVSSIYSSWLST